MDKLNKKFYSLLFLFVFILLLSVFTTVSYANADLFKVGEYSFSSSPSNLNSTSTGTSIPKYNGNTSDDTNRRFLYDLFEDMSTGLQTDLSYTTADFEAFVADSFAYYNDLYGTNYNSYYFGKNSGTNNFSFVLYNSSEFDAISLPRKNVSNYNDVHFTCVSGASYVKLSTYQYSYGATYYSDCSAGYITTFSTLNINVWPPKCNSTIKVGTFVSESNTYYVTWDGDSYYQFIEDEPEEPLFPTNAEIASAVQKFYNSDIYKNNTNFKDFIVVYSALKNTYAFIGTDITLNQHIYYDGVSDFSGFSSSETWWCFHNPRILDGYLYNNKFYLYFIEGDSDVITNEGVGTIADLQNSRYSMNMTIVYSTYDYIVYEHRPPLEGETDNQVTSGTIQGDSYTYDENLDPTDSQYSPLQNYVPSDPTQSILNDVDFEAINKSFEDGKVILNIENASWIFTANNQLVEYFLGFISFLVVLVAISRVLGG